VRAEAIDETSEKRLEELYIAAREDEYTEFLAECDKFDAEIESEIRKRKFTWAELDEEEQNFDRLTRWLRELSRKSFFPIPSAAAAEERIKGCEESLAKFAEFIFKADER